MARITIEDCTKQVGNRFSLVLMAAIRAKQLKRGARPLVKAEENRAVVVALREIAAGFVKPDLPEAAPSEASETAES
ncbi:MAG: DNA-directed RNA polymerase subunit omega [Myxococcota bacterium]